MWLASGKAAEPTQVLPSTISWSAAFPPRPAAMRSTGTTVLKVVDGRIAEEVGLDDGVTALTQLGLIRAAA